MGSIYKRGKNWYMDVRVKGRRVRKKVGSSKEIAKLALKDAEVKIAREEFGFSKRDIGVDDFINLFLDYSKASHRPTSTSRYRAVLDNFRVFLGINQTIKSVSGITTEVIDRYKVFRREPSEEGQAAVTEGRPNVRAKAEARTVNFELDTLRTVFNMAIKWGYLKENPTKGVTRLKIDDSKRPRFLTTKECHRFLEACPPGLRPVFLMFMHTGMRKAELENLQWEDIDLSRRRIEIRAKVSWSPKTGERVIPINDALLAILKEIRGSGRQPRDSLVFEAALTGRSKNHLRDQLIKIAQAVDIADFTKIHTLRHTFASHLVMKGVDLPTVQRLMGHSDIETTMIYAHLAPDHIAEAINRLDFE